MRFRCLALLSLLLPDATRGSFRIDDSLHDVKQQSNTLTNALVVSAEAREALHPGRFGEASFLLRGPHSGGLHAAHKQEVQLRAPSGQHRFMRFRGLGAFRPFVPRRATVALDAASGPEQAEVRSSDFSGSWRMDLKASDSLGPMLRELGVPRILAAVLTRLAVSQEIRQDATQVEILVKTPLSTDTLLLHLNGTEGLLPGITGGRTVASSKWLNDGRLETRQCVDEGARLDDAGAKLFVTTRSLQDGGKSLLEDCSVVQGGVVVEGAIAKRILRRVRA